MKDFDENAPTLLRAERLSVHFDVRIPGAFMSRRGVLRAVDDVDVSISAGETLAIVGESGCGKSTLSRALVGLISPTSGTLSWCGRPLFKDGKRIQMWPHKDIQIIFQDPLACLDPRMTVFKLIAEPLRLHAPGLSDEQVARRVHDIMEKVGLSAQTINRYPHEFSGGQCQRIGIARALICAPKLLICDEPVSALDVSIRAQIVNLLMDMQREYGLALLFIAHDLAIVRHIATRVAVMYLGRVLEQAPTGALFDNPSHPYTRMLLSAVPVPDPKVARNRPVVIRRGELPSPLSIPSGCVFHTRCAEADVTCAQNVPQWRVIDANLTHGLRCLHVQQNP